jgi:hypothetical protein
MNLSWGCVSLERWQVQMGRRRRRLGEVLARKVRRGRNRVRPDWLACRYFTIGERT